MTAFALIGIGSNLGDSESLVHQAVARLRALGPVRCSTLWRTVPLDCADDAANFVNAVVALKNRAPESLPEPHALLLVLQAIERDFGQRAATPNAPRYLDLDLLAMDDLRIDDAQLALPHPRALSRHFVLHPAAELEPDYVWPGTNKTLATLAAALPDSNDWGSRLGGRWPNHPQ